MQTNTNEQTYVSNWNIGIHEDPAVCDEPHSPCGERPGSDTDDQRTFGKIRCEPPDGQQGHEGTYVGRLHHRPARNRLVHQSRQNIPVIVRTATAADRNFPRQRADGSLGQVLRQYSCGTSEKNRRNACDRSSRFNRKFR